MIKKTFFIIFIVLSLSACSFTSSDISSDNQASVETPPTIQKVEITINSGNQQVYTSSIDFEQDLTAFRLLEQSVQEHSLNLETKDYDFGVLIETIDGKTNGHDNKYWLYYVNDEMPMVSVDKYQLKADDKVEFRFEESIF